MSRSHYDVEIEHWLLKILEQGGTDLDAIIKQFDIDSLQFHRNLSRALDGFKTGNADPPGLSTGLIQLAQDAWVIGSIELGASQTRTGHLICALLDGKLLSHVSDPVASDLRKISAKSLKDGFYQILADSPESSSAPPKVSPEFPGAKTLPGQPSSTPSLDQFTVDLTEKARSGGIDPVLERDAEIRQITDILTRRRQNNPILTGEAGVGKTAVVEGFALRVASGDVPESLKNASIRTLDLALLQAGAGIKGEFEQRLKTVINEVKASPQPIILFIDEAHTMIGAGGTAGQGDAANLLKPALARGELRTIAATTWAEYKKYFEKDAALARRFQVVKIDEPTEQSAITMMNGIVGILEQHHHVRILNEAIVESVRLSNRYISGRQLPDKSVSLLDTTCARIGLSHSSTPAPIEDRQRRIDKLTISIGMLEREVEDGEDHEASLQELRESLQNTTQELAELNQRWEIEKDLVRRIKQLTCRDSLKSPADQLVTQPVNEQPVEEVSAEERIAKLTGMKKELATLQGEQPLVYAEVNAQSVAETAASWTGIPLGRMVADEIQTMLQLEKHLEKSIIGQSHALQQIAQVIRTSRANLNDPRSPIGVFLLAGTSGVGKTETAITLAEMLYGGEQNMTTINMSEFKEEHKVSLLLGSPPGYVGYGEGGVLTEAVRRKPYSVILLDEMEKAHPGVQDVFYQVFDKGNIKDGEGRDIDFKNTVIIMTSNAGTDLIKDLCADPDVMPTPEGFLEAVFPELLKTFKPAFLGRVKVIPYYPLRDDVLKKIIHLKLAKISKRIRDNYRASLNYDAALVEEIAARCTEVDTGARNVDHILTKTILPELSAEFLSALAEGRAIASVTLDVSDTGAFTYLIS